MLSSAELNDLRAHMLALFEWKAERGPGSQYFNLLPWWRDPSIIAGIGQLLADPFEASGPTVVIGPAASGYLTGALTAASLGIGFCPIRKDPAPVFDSDTWVTVTSPPDYLDRHVEFGIRKGLIKAGDKVLAVDDLIDTGGQLLALQTLVERIEATWLGASVVIDKLQEHGTRRQLKLKSVFHERDL